MTSCLTLKKNHVSKGGKGGVPSRFGENKRGEYKKKQVAETNLKKGGKKGVGIL